VLKILAAATLGLALVNSAHAQGDYPSKPIRFVLVSSAGSGGDAIGRLLADKMAPLLKASFVVDNRPGAGGALAGDAVAKAPPDGYTIGLGGFSSHVLLPITKPKFPYDPVKDFAMVGQFGTASILLVASNDYPASNLKEFIAYAKKSPEAPLYASWGTASTGHFCGELLSQRAGIKLTHVPYKGVAAIQNDMYGGQIKLGFVDMATGTPMVQSGRVKAIASCLARSPSLPNVRGYIEDGVDLGGKEAVSPMWAVYAPAATPKPVVDKLSAALKQVVEMPDVKAKLLDFGVTTDFMAGEAYRQHLAAGLQQWREIATKANIKLED